ncbi:MAG: glycosyltransferase family 4 protein [Nitrospinae bacterium]|nr:glycosyltransferase family 4 protein [Nitrospinota bacterium]
MNILFVSPFDLVPQRLWGPTARLHALAKEFRAMGHIAILAGGEPYTGQKAEALDGVPFAHLPTAPFHRYPYDDGVREKIMARWKPFFLPRVLWLTVKRVAAIRKICRKENIEVIYLGRTFPETALACFIIRLFTGIPVVVDWDDVEGLMGFSSKMRLPLWMQYLYTFCETFFAKRANAVVAASAFLCEYARDVGVQQQKLFYAPTFGDHKMFTPNGRSTSTDSPTLFYAGNLRSDNGLNMELLIETFALVKMSVPGARLLVVGGGDLIGSGVKPGPLPWLAQKLGVADSVEFTGDIPHRQMPALLERADICLALFPVNVITLAKSPIKVYEYLCAGKPVVARAVGEINGCITDCVNGILVYTDSPNEYAQKIVAALKDPDRLDKVGENARRSVEEQFNWPASARKALEACEAALAAAK